MEISGGAGSQVGSKLPSSRGAWPWAGATSWCRADTCLFLSHRRRHLEAFLYIKANLSRGELKSILSYLEDSTVSTPPSNLLFSSINLS